jgi:hypothetical protein
VQEHACLIIGVSTDWSFDVSAAPEERRIGFWSIPRRLRVRPAAASQDVNRPHCFRLKLMRINAAQRGHWLSFRNGEMPTPS